MGYPSVSNSYCMNKFVHELCILFCNLVYICIIFILIVFYFEKVFAMYKCMTSAMSFQQQQQPPPHSACMYVVEQYIHSFMFKLHMDTQEDTCGHT